MPAASDAVAEAAAMAAACTQGILVEPWGSPSGRWAALSTGAWRTLLKTRVPALDTDYRTRPSHASYARVAYSHTCINCAFVPVLGSHPAAWYEVFWMDRAVQPHRCRVSSALGHRKSIYAALAK